MTNEEFAAKVRRERKDRIAFCEFQAKRYDEAGSLAERNCDLRKADRFWNSAYIMRREIEALEKTLVETA